MTVAVCRGSIAPILIVTGAFALRRRVSWMARAASVADRSYPLRPAAQPGSLRVRVASRARDSGGAPVGAVSAADAGVGRDIDGAPVGTAGAAIERVGVNVVSVRAVGTCSVVGSRASSLKQISS